jgi:hypothetical protein
MQIVTSNSRVLLSGMPAATLADNYLIAGCAFNVAGKPQPCMRVQWLTPATRVLVNGQPVILQTSTGLCLSPEQAPQGPAIIASAQVRVIAA